MELISIQRLSGELNISSRALRHYEKEGLIESYRNNKIRYYSKEMIHKIKIIILFRQFDISLSDIKSVLENFNPEEINKLINKKKETVIAQLRTATMNWINLQNVMKFLENERDVLTKTTLGDLYDVYAQLPKEFSPWNMRHQIIHDIFAYAFGKLTYNDIKGDLTEPFTEEIMRSIIKSLELDVELSRYEIGLCTYGESSRMYVDVYNKEDRITLLFLISLDNKISGIWLHEKGKITKCD